MLNEKTIFVKLYLGEQDGHTAEVQTVNGVWPKMFYVHRACDNAMLAEAERRYANEPEAFELLKSAAEVLAYEFAQADPKDGVPGGKQYVYSRCEARDRALSDPAV